MVSIEMSNINGTGGIVNVGFTCYANATLQAFRHCYNVENLFHEDKYSTILKKDCKFNELTKQFANLIQSLSNIQNTSSIRPNGFWNAFSEVAQDSCFEHLISRKAHDAHEFLMFLLDSLHESLSRKVNMNITKCDLKSERQIFQNKSLEVWKNSFENCYSPFVDLFFGLFHIQTLCETCSFTSNKWETFNTLKGVIKKQNEKPTLIECIMGELNEEVIDDYACDKCAPKRSRAIRKTRIWKLPKNLIIVLKRFTYDGQKIHTPIESFGPEISFHELFSQSSPNRKSCDYKLNSIIDHHGSSHGGHYTAQAKHRIEEKWFLYDDQNVHSIEGPSLGESSYIFFLESK